MNQTVSTWRLRRILGAAALALPVFFSTLEAQETPLVPPTAVSTGSGRDEVRASHILVASKEEAEAIRKEVTTAGGDKKAFGATARKQSKDVTTKLLGGDVGWFRQNGGMDKAFTDSAYALKVGEMSPPVQSQFGWHLIFLTDRREIGTNAPPPTNPPPTFPKQPTAPQNPAPTTPAPTQGPNGLLPAAVPGETPVVAATPIAAPALVVDAKRPPRSDQMSFRLSIETVSSQRLNAQQFTYTLDQAAEINLVLKNESSKEQKFFARELLPLGLKVTAVGELAAVPGDFSGVAEPASYFASMKPYEITGIEASVNDYWKSIPARRYTVTWDVATLVANVEARFPKAKEQPDYAPFAEASKKRLPVTTDVVTREISQRTMGQRSRALPLSFMEALKPDGKYYAQIKLAGAEEPVTIELATQKQFPAVKQFVALVNEGYYDGLDFFDVEDGDYLLGGDPTRTGNGAPAGNLPAMRNDAKLEHKRGTVSFVSRNLRRQAPVRGGQVGSIFVVCLKPHPEWNDEHVPFGEVISGIESLEKPGARSFREVSILTEDQLKARGTDTTPKPPAAVAGNPEALIKTSKGNLTVELFEDVARNTVSNFVTLAGDKFFDKISKGDGKQKFFVMKDEAGKPLLVQTGSPTNDPEGGPGYNIPSEVNLKKVAKGSLVMAVAYDETNKIYVPDSAGSQFFVCLQDIPYYDFLKAFTVFGQVTSGLDVLEKLTDADTIDSVEISKKKPHPYTVRKVTTP